MRVLASREFLGPPLQGRSLLPRADTSGAQECVALGHAQPCQHLVTSWP